MTAPRILIADDQTAVREELAYAMQFEGYRTAEAPDGEAALALLEQGDVGVVLLDIKMPGLDGLQVLQRIRERWPGVPVVMITGHGDIETAVVAIKNGAFDFLPKPFDSDRVLVSVKNALRLCDLYSENQALRAERAEAFQLIGASPAIAEVRRLIERVAPTEASVLITGENGTGKELVARQIHLRSRRGTGPFVALNCAAIPADLLESELFGHERGAFTGAVQARAGHFEAAHRGTLFLDEIGDLAADAQAKLLRALQEKTITRVGGAKPIEVDVRVVAATNQDLDAMVAAKEFREDLYWRLHVIRIHVPPLRERGGDVELLAEHFLREACRRNGLGRRRLGPDARTALRTMPWPGNVRELKNLIEAAAILAEQETIGPADLPGSTGALPAAAGTVDWFDFETLDEFRAATEKEFIRRKLESNGGNIKRTAERIQIQRSNLYKKLERYGLK
jgi:two-component system nitrogen regulation response regulator NtrX